MIELELYRTRIGTFISKLTSNKCKNVKLFNHVSRDNKFRVKTAFMTGTLGLFLVLLSSRLGEQQAKAWSRSHETTSCEILNFEKLICQQLLHGKLKENTLDNTMNILEFRNNFRLFSYILTKEEKYQIHDGSKNYTPKVHIHTDNTSYTTEHVNANCTVERHGNTSYLLGNSGQHAYNGNPPKRRRDDDTPSTSKNKKIKLQPSTSKNIKNKLHCKMFIDLNGCLNPSKKTEWTAFMFALRTTNLSDTDIASIKTMFEVCLMLERTGEIKYGEYDILRELFSMIKHQRCCDIVDKYLAQIKEVEFHHTDKETDSTGTATLKRGQDDYMALYVEKWKEQDKLCYETKGVKVVKEKICNQSCVCVIGVPGSGKSMAIRHAALHLQETSQYTIYPIDTPVEFKKYIDKDKKQVFVIDNVVGEHFVNTEMLGLWDRLNEMIKSCLEVSKNTKFVTSMHHQVSLDDQLEGKTYIFTDKDNQVNFSDKDFKLTLDDTKNMLRRNLEVRNAGNIEALIEDICGRGWWGKYVAAKSADCFPLLCKVFSDNKAVRKNPENFFTAPFPALTDIFRQIKRKNKHQFCGLLLCVFTELKHEYFSYHYPREKPKVFTSLIESQNLDPKKELADIEKALKALEGVYISQIANKYVFLHSIFRDITAFLYEDEYVIFQYATRDFIESRVRLFFKSSEDDNYVLVFHGDDCIELIVNRMIHELKCQTEKEGIRFIAYNRYIDDERVVNGLCTKLFDSQDTDITQDMVGGLFGRCTEAVCGYNIQHRDNRDVMSWPCHKLLTKMFSSFDCTRQKYVIFQHAICDFINSRVRLFSKLREDDDYVLVLHGEDCIELLANRMIHELKCQTLCGRARFIVCNRYIDDERVVNSLFTKLFDSQDTDITQDMVDWLFGSCMMAVWEYSTQHRVNRDETTWPCYKLLVGLISRVDCTRPMDVLLGIYPICQCIETGSLSLVKLVVQQNSEVINAINVYNKHSVLHTALRCVNNVEMTRYLLSLTNFTQLNHRDRDNRTPYWWIVHCKHSWSIGSGNVREITNRREMMAIYKQAGAIALGNEDDSSDDSDYDDVDKN